MLQAGYYILSGVFFVAATVLIIVKDDFLLRAMCFVAGVVCFSASGAVIDVPSVHLEFAYRRVYQCSGLSIGRFLVFTREGS